jgi:hypothetical protein
MVIKSKDISIENKEIVSFIKRQTPSDYIDFCTKSKLGSGDKAKLTKIWLGATKYKIKDLEYARNRHPYWKKLKEKGSVERNKIRLEKYNFYDRKKYGRNKKWSDDELREFLKLNDQKRDWELAQHFERSIPSIQFIRRKIQLALKLADINNVKKIDKNYIYKMVVEDETVLRREYFGSINKKSRGTKRK